MRIRSALQGEARWLWCGCRSSRSARCRKEEGGGLEPYGACPNIRTKLARTRFWVSIKVTLRVAKSGTSAARVSSRSRPGPAVFGSNGPAQAQTQDLGQVVIKLRRRAQHFGVLDRQQP